MPVWAWDAGPAPWASSAMTRAAPNNQATARASGECIGTGIIGKFPWLDKVERREIRCWQGTALAPAIRGGGSCHPLLSGRSLAQIFDCLGQPVPGPHGAGVLWPADLLPPAQYPDEPVCAGLAPPGRPQGRPGGPHAAQLPSGGHWLLRRIEGRDVGGGDQSPVHRHRRRAPRDRCVPGNDYRPRPVLPADRKDAHANHPQADHPDPLRRLAPLAETDRKSTRLNSSHGYISYAVFCLKKKKKLTSCEGLD